MSPRPRYVSSRQRREDLPLLVAELPRRRGFEPGPIRGPGEELMKSNPPESK
ncbi:hypothetical protein JQX13_01935 [Archangium violaceum]|uniref:hypothetical protein n=1 Tax=Archangium violaceum TaxID=83451 RepID=UPI00193B7539|nr:hypothetical protein [Archangium violaceum]QRK08956.1 hypothetical protein JQX13_01935 [Archangium violaceum]